MNPDLRKVTPRQTGCLTHPRRLGRDRRRNDHPHPWLPPTAYGYWVSPSGRFHPVDGLMHVGFAARKLKRRVYGEGLGNEDCRIDLLARGWTRVAVHSRRLVIQLPPRAVDPEVIRRLHVLLDDAYAGRALPLTVTDPLTGENAEYRPGQPGPPRFGRAWAKIAQVRGFVVRVRPAARNSRPGREIWLGDGRARAGQQGDATEVKNG